MPRKRSPVTITENELSALREHLYATLVEKGDRPRWKSDKIDRAKVQSRAFEDIEAVKYQLALSRVPAMRDCMRLPECDGLPDWKCLRFNRFRSRPGATLLTGDHACDSCRGKLECWVVPKKGDYCYHCRFRKETQESCNARRAFGYIDSKDIWSIRKAISDIRIICDPHLSKVEKDKVDSLVKEITGPLDAVDKLLRTAAEAGTAEANNTGRTVKPSSTHQTAEPQAIRHTNPVVQPPSVPRAIMQQPARVASGMPLGGSFHDGANQPPELDLFEAFQQLFAMSGSSGTQTPRGADLPTNAGLAAMAPNAVVGGHSDPLRQRWATQLAAIDPGQAPARPATEPFTLDSLFRAEPGVSATTRTSVDTAAYYTLAPVAATPTAIDNTIPADSKPFVPVDRAWESGINRGLYTCVPLAHSQATTLLHTATAQHNSIGSGPVSRNMIPPVEVSGPVQNTQLPAEAVPANAFKRAASSTPERVQYLPKRPASSAAVTNDAEIAPESSVSQA